MGIRKGSEEIAALACAGRVKATIFLNRFERAAGIRMQLSFAYSWKLPAHSGAFPLTVDNFGVFTYSWSFFAYRLLQLFYLH